MDKVKIGQFIANCRKDKKLTQEQLAEKLGISINAISKWERGLNLPDVSLMKELCKILDITLNELFEGKKLTNNEMFDKAENNIISLMMTLKLHMRKIPVSIWICCPGIHAESITSVGMIQSLFPIRPDVIRMAGAAGHSAVKNTRMTLRMTTKTRTRTTNMTESAAVP